MQQNDDEKSLPEKDNPQTDIAHNKNPENHDPKPGSYASDDSSKQQTQMKEPSNKLPTDYTVSYPLPLPCLLGAQ